MESESTSDGVPSLELMEKALLGARLCLSTDGSKLGCRRACLLQQKHFLKGQIDQEIENVIAQLTPFRGSNYDSAGVAGGRVFTEGRT